MSKYGIIRWFEDNDFMVFRLKNVKELEDDPNDFYCRISKVIYNTSNKLETDKSRKRWRPKYGCRWQKDAYINKTDIFEFEDDDAALLAMEVM